MLVLGRKVSDDDLYDTILIYSPRGEKLIIKLLELRNDGQTIRIGIDAPSSYRILRGEIDEI